jgi:hypothetical protein
MISVGMVAVSILAEKAQGVIVVLDSGIWISTSKFAGTGSDRSRFRFLLCKDQPPLTHHVADQIVNRRKHFDGRPRIFLQTKLTQDTFELFLWPRDASLDK